MLLNLSFSTGWGFAQSLSPSQGPTQIPGLSPYVGQWVYLPRSPNAESYTIFPDGTFVMEVTRQVGLHGGTPPYPTVCQMRYLGRVLAVSRPDRATLLAYSQSQKIPPQATISFHWSQIAVAATAATYASGCQQFAHLASGAGTGRLDVRFDRRGLIDAWSLQSFARSPLPSLRPVIPPGPSLATPSEAGGRIIDNNIRNWMAFVGFYGSAARHAAAIQQIFHVPSGSCLEAIMANLLEDFGEDLTDPGVEAGLRAMIPLLQQVGHSLRPQSCNADGSHT